MASTRDQATGHVIVCGLHALGLRVVESLRRAGSAVVVVDDNPDRPLLPRLEDWGVPFVAGSPRQPSTLVAAGALQARAVICVEDNDLLALESALAVHQLRPDLQVVSEISNTAVSRALQRVTGPRTVLDTAALAAPSIVQACEQDTTHPLTLDHVRFAVSQTRCDRPASLRDLYGDLVPLAVVSPGSTDVDVCPGRDRMVHPGDAVTVLGTPEELRRQALAEPPLAEVPHHLPDDARRARRREVVAVARSVWGETNAAFRLTLLAIFALVGVSTLVLRLGYDGPRHSHLSVLNAVYFTVETIATVGFGDFSYSTQSTWMRIFGIGVIILGVTLVTTLFALVTNLLFSRNVAAVLGHQRIGRMQHHVVVVGLGAIGVRVVQGLLARGTSVVVIERDEHNRHLEQARELHVPILVGDATQTSTLSLANAERASALAVLTSNDLTNLEAGLTAQDHLQQAGSDAPVVLRVFDRELSQSIERNFGFRSVRSTAALAAPWFVGAALGLDIESTFYVEHQLFLVARLTVATSGGLAGVAMGELSARIRVIAISRSPAHQQLEHPPRRNTRFAPGDRAYLVGPPEELLALLRRDAEGAPLPQG